MRSLTHPVLVSLALFGAACGNPNPEGNVPPAQEPPAETPPDAGEQLPQKPAIASVKVETDPEWVCLPSCLFLKVNEQRVLIATVLDTEGAIRDDVEVVWASANEGTAVVDQEGVVTGKSAGIVEITATAEGVTGSITLRVEPARVAKITVTPHPATVGAGETVQMHAEAEDDLGNVLDDVEFQWFTGNSNLATVDENGLVTGVGRGVTVIVATSERGFGSDGWATVTVESAEAPPAGFAMTALALAAPHGCGVGADAKTYCWGWNYFGQMGVGRLDKNTDNFPVPEEVLGGHPFVQTILGGYHSCALEADGKAWCWGLNEKGQLGTHETIGVVGGTVEPFEVLGNLRFAQMSTAQAHTCGVATDGTAYCWGMGSDGSIGNASIADQPVPTPVFGQNTWKKIVTGLSSSCGIDDDGKAWCWGRNGQGQLGTGATATEQGTVIIPTEVVGGRTYEDIALDGSHVCALDATGAAWCWGNNTFGQLGDGTTTNQTEPVAVDTTERFVQIAVAAHHSCAVQADGDVFCWGNNSSGQLGNGGLADALRPVKVMGGHSFKLVDTAGNVSCGITVAGETHCWGSAYFGESAAGFSGGLLVAPNPVVPPAEAPPAP